MNTKKYLDYNGLYTLVSAFKDLFPLKTDLSAKEDINNKVNSFDTENIDNTKYPTTESIYNLAKNSFNVITTNSNSSPFSFSDKYPGVYFLDPSLVGTTFYYKQNDSEVSSLTHRRILYIVITRNILIDSSNGDIGYYLYLNQSQGNSNFRLECMTIVKDSSGVSMFGVNTGDFGYLLNGIAQTFQGTKTFSAIPRQANTTAPTRDDEFTNKKYVNDQDIAIVNNIASAYDATATYSVGDYVIYNKILYKCSTAISTAEAWTAAHWTQTTVMAEIINTVGNINTTLATLTTPTGGGN